MRRRIAMMLVFAACVPACGILDSEGTAPPRARIWTLFDLSAIADRGGNVAAGGGISGGLPASYFLKPHVDPAGESTARYELTVSRGFLDGLPMRYVTTELWANFAEVWAQPLYRAVDDQGAILDDPEVREPWVFGVGPRSLFYSPFWQVFGFRVPPDTDVATVRDTRAVLAAASRTGGLLKMELRVTSLAPPDIVQAGTWVESIYFDDSAAWDGLADRRYIDLGAGRFDIDGAAVVRQFPIFMFTKRSESGAYAPMTDWPTVGGTRGLFSVPPGPGNLDSGAIDAVADGGVSPAAEPTARDLVYGGLWRMHTVALPDSAALTPDGRVVMDGGCLMGPGTGLASCVVLDSQAAIERLGAAAVRPTELLAACPLVRLGGTDFPRGRELPPQPRPAP